jgi:hypothetical protein
MFFTDLSIHLNELNLKLQGKGKIIGVLFGFKKFFKAKIEVYKRDLRIKDLNIFHKQNFF